MPYPLIPASLTLDGMISLPGYCRDGEWWNGFECPVFDLEVLRARRDDLAQVFTPDDIARDGITWDAQDRPHLFEYFDNDRAPEDAISTVTYDGREYIDIGSYGFTWICEYYTEIPQQ